jgi:hypothetical protein
MALLDLGVALPATVAVCTDYRRAARRARVGLYAVTGWFALVGAAVAGMAIAMQLRGEPAMTVSEMLVMIVRPSRSTRQPYDNARTVRRPAEARPTTPHRTRPDGRGRPRRPVGAHGVPRNGRRPRARRGRRRPRPPGSASS